MMRKQLFEKIYKDKRTPGLVSLMKPMDLMKVLIKVSNLKPKAAARMVFDLKKKVEGIGGPSIEPNKQFPVPPVLRKDEDEVEEGLGSASPSGKTAWGQGGGPPDDGTGKSPPDSIEKEKEFPYGDVFKNYMNSPKGHRRGLTSGKNPLIKLKNNPLNIDMKSGQPGGGGNGLQQSTTASNRGNSTSASGTATPKMGTPGWSSSPQGQEFDLPDNDAKKPFTDERKIPNAGDDDDDPKFLKQANVGQTIWNPATGLSGTSNYRKKPWRGYGKR